MYLYFQYLYDTYYRCMSELSPPRYPKMRWHPLKGEWLIVSKFVSLIPQQLVLLKGTMLQKLTTTRRRRFPCARRTICPCPRNWWKRRTTVDPFGMPGVMHRLGVENGPKKGRIGRHFEMGSPFPTSISMGGKSIIWLELYCLSNTCFLLVYSWLFSFLL